MTSFQLEVIWKLGGSKFMYKFILLLFIAILSSCTEEPPRYNGYIDADLTYLSSNFAGRLESLLVSRGQSVQKNQLLFKLEQTNENFAVAINQFTKNNLLSQRKEILNQIEYNDINYQRTLRMRKQNAASQNDLDLAKKDLDVLKNRLMAINFQISSSQVDIADKNWQMQRKEGHATDFGIIFDTYFTKDEYVLAGQPVLSLITKNNIKVIFFIPEKKLSSILINDKIKISSDGNEHLGTGTINYISNIAQYIPPIVYSREDRQNLVFRVEARIDNPNLNQVHLGQPVTMEIRK